MNFKTRFKKIPAEAELPVRNRVFLQRRWAARMTMHRLAVIVSAVFILGCQAFTPKEE